ncbi:M20 family metallopeptidase [Marinomonas mediterranea]|jgi:Acetylornithine deacetylase/Succinyl-diaminopimelate desuccinylase and related deacylases|uniref:Peptidase dimerization domain protein n=1 Tax=Marinomonas mediterranea (strain ATCC 700492 / JCM 21426 / NBRC 103028 / MMB-1) TaxID=717774 RepID=F2K333_MARM1|nr:M20 family metallopeptidase [Marinomonas mediterranea]ADZ90086.1 peptidase dimerization domain protein [Marinomonas mediterranea MMB-1]WCN16291.1 M20/M25/M40 family metallo-hydrolase [Marinomonas mediterranea MMB-1]
MEKALINSVEDRKVSFASDLEHYADLLCDWIAKQEDAMIDCLEALVNVDSNSYDKAGVDAAGKLMESWLVEDGITCSWHSLENSGDVLEARVGFDESNANAPAIFVMGHRDTVFPKGTLETRCFSRDGMKAFGPGVADMKSGLVLNCFVLKGLQHLLKTSDIQQLPFPVIGLFTGDEEIGSPEGRYVIRDRVAGARAVFNAEPGRISGNVVSARKGGASFEIQVTGKAAHSGVNHADGISAIGALAQLVTSLHALTDYDKGITTNVGLISGGMSSNTVAPTATARLDLRFITLEQGEEVKAKINAIIETPVIEGAIATIKILSEFQPFEASMSDVVLAHYQRQANSVGFSVEGEFTGGCSDAGFTSSMGVPTLCGTGPVGAKMHTDDEYCLLDTFVPRTQAVAKSILLL